MTSPQTTEADRLTRLTRARVIVAGIAEMRGKTLLGPGDGYSEGANAAFEQAADLASAAMELLDHMVIDEACYVYR